MRYWSLEFQNILIYSNVCKSLQTFCLLIGKLFSYTNIVPVPYAEIFKWSRGAFYFYYKRYAWKVGTQKP